MARKVKKKWVILFVVFVLAGWWFYNHYYTGSRSGRVVDAITGKPIKGAVVCMQWSGGGFMSIVASHCVALYETKTDEKGRYYIPSQRIEGGTGKESVMIYKDGYSGYKVYGDELKLVGRSFGHKNEEQTYHKRRNVVRLFPFEKPDSHRDHLRWIETYGIFGWPKQLLEKELQNEMKRAREER